MFLIDGRGGSSLGRQASQTTPVSHGSIPTKLVCIARRCPKQGTGRAVLAMSHLGDLGSGGNLGRASAPGFMGARREELGQGS